MDTHGKLWAFLHCKLSEPGQQAKTFITKTKRGKIQIKQSIQADNTSELYTIILKYMTAHVITTAAPGKGL